MANEEGEECGGLQRATIDPEDENNLNWADEVENEHEARQGNDNPNKAGTQSTLSRWAMPQSRVEDNHPTSSQNE